MGDQSNSKCSNILSESRGRDIPIALNFAHPLLPLKVTQAEDNQVANKLYVTKKLKQELLCKIQRQFSPLQCSGESYVGKYTASLKEQIDFLKNEIFFGIKISAKNMS